jgi:hypothetical protein
MKEKLEWLPGYEPDKDKLKLVLKLIAFFGTLLIVIMMTSCQQTQNFSPEEGTKNITYFKDQNTGLCFAALNSTSYGFYEVTSIACVPCDSLEKTIWRRH